MYSYGPSHMAGQKQDDQFEHTYSSSVNIRDVALKTCQRRWTIGRSGERGSRISVQAAWHDDDDIYSSLHIYQSVCHSCHVFLLLLSLSLFISLSQYKYVCVCLYIYIYIYMCVCVYVCVPACVCISVSSYLSIYLSIYLSVDWDTCIFAPASSRWCWSFLPSPRICNAWWLE